MLCSNARSHFYGPLALPASVGLALTAGARCRCCSDQNTGSWRPGWRWLRRGYPGYFRPLWRNGAVACRHDTDALRLTMFVFALAAVLMPSLAACAGPAGVGAAAVAVELAGAFGGWALLNRLGIRTGNGPSYRYISSWLSNTGGRLRLAQESAAPCHLPGQCQCVCRHLGSRPTLAAAGPSIRRPHAMTAILTIDDPGYFEHLAGIESAHWWSFGMRRLESHWLKSILRGKQGLRRLTSAAAPG